MDNLMIVVSLIGLFVIGTQCEECLRVPKTLIQCFDEQASITVSLQCPDTHRIQIKEAGYWIARDLSCPTRALNTTLATKTKDLGTIVEECSGFSCSHDVTKVDPARAQDVYGVSGQHYLQVEYRCIPDQDNQDVSKSISICEAATIDGNMVTIRSYGDPHVRTYLNSTSCACRVYMKANTQIEFRRLQFDVSPASYSRVCDPRVAMWTREGDPNSICHPEAASGGDPTFGCYDDDNHINLSFENRDEDYSVAFTIEASAPENQMLTVTCGMDASNMNWTMSTVTRGRRLSTTTRLPSTTRTTTAPGEPARQTSGPSKNTQIIVGVAVALVAIIVIVVIVIFIRLRKSKEVEEYDKNFNPSNSFYATISKGANGEAALNLGSQKAYPRIHAMPDGPTTAVESPVPMPDEDADIAL